MKDLIDALAADRTLPRDELIFLLKNHENEGLLEYLRYISDSVRRSYYSNKIFIRGLIEFSNYCRCGCRYCGINACNKNVLRYRLGKEEILASCRTGYGLGFRTFVLQGGEDVVMDKEMPDIVASIKENYPDCAVTLSLGERSRDYYQELFDAGADRFLLRHETADKEHYVKLHPKGQTLENRIRCLYDLKDIGYQVGSGFMVGSPYQTLENLADDLIFLKELGPHMIGIGPFIPHHDTEFANYPAGSLKLTLFLLGMLRLMHPNALLPSTTALATLSEQGRSLGIQMGANVIMPNLSPDNASTNYQLYDNKLITGSEAAKNLESLKKKMNEIGFEIVTDRGDAKHL